MSCCLFRLFVFVFLKPGEGEGGGGIVSGGPEPARAKSTPLHTTGIIVCWCVCLLNPGGGEGGGGEGTIFGGPELARAKVYQTAYCKHVVPILFHLAFPGGGRRRGGGQPETLCVRGRCGQASSLYQRRPRLKGTLVLKLGLAERHFSHTSAICLFDSQTG